MAAGHEVVVAEHREAHEVEVVVADPLRLPVLVDPPQPEVRGDVEPPVGRIDPQAMDVRDPGVLLQLDHGQRRVGGGLLLLAGARCEEEQPGAQAQSGDLAGSAEGHHRAPGIDSDGIVSRQPASVTSRVAVMPASR
jgi:hypothetical protein